MRYKNARGLDTKLRQIDRGVNGEMFGCRPISELASNLLAGAV
jgi:hypothetical protein